MRSMKGSLGDIYGGYSANGAFYGRNPYTNLIAAGSGREFSEVYFDSSRAMPTDNEIRPVNIAVRYLIRALP